MSFWCLKKKLYPLVALLSSIVILVFGLISAKTFMCSVFLLFTLILVIVFGCYKALFRVFPLFIFVGGIFALIAYYSSDQNIMSAIAMLNRFGTVCLALIIGMSIEPVRMTRNLTQLHMPRAITLGMLIALSFTPVLRGEIKRVREAMKTRGAGSIINPKIFYRAFLIPLVTRLVDISDTLSLSIETRGFTLNNTEYTVYKKESICLYDLIFIMIFIAGMALTVVIL